MPHCECNEKPLIETKPCKSHEKKCVSPVCKTDCCKDEEVLDCCTPAYQRLNRVINGWSDIVTGTASLPLEVNVTQEGAFIDGVHTSANQDILVPTVDIFETGLLVNDNGVGLVSLPTQSASTDLVVDLDLSYFAYLFTNTLRYSPNQECGKKDQIFAWLFDTANENLEIFQNLPDFNLTTNVNRLSLLNISNENLTRLQKKQLAALNNFYKISIKALAKAVSPRREGSIVQVCDKHGQKWLVAINTSDSDVDIVNTEFVVVAIPLC